MEQNNLQIPAESTSPHEQQPLQNVVPGTNSSVPQKIPVQEPNKETETATTNEAEMEPKKKKSRAKGLKIALAVLVLSSCIIAIYLTNAEKEKGEIVPQKPVQAEKPIENPYPVDDNDANWKEFTNQKYEFYLKYPVKGVLTQYDISQEEPSVFKVYFTPNTSKIVNTESVDEADINEGLLFKVTVVKDIELKTPETAALEKINYFKSFCPETSKISGLEHGTFSGFDSQAFMVQDCKGNYKVTFVKRKTNMYEFSQFTTGDVGFEQRYRATTDKMLSNLRLTNTIAPVPLEKWIELTKDGITLKHPQMDDKCCSISGPISVEGQEDPSPIIVLAMPNGINASGTSFNGIGIFKSAQFTNDEEVKNYIEKQKAALVEEYKIIVGKNPETHESGITVGEHDATYVQGLAWWGDMVFIPIKDDTGRITIYMIAKTEVLKGEFESIFKEILSTVQIGAK